MRFYRFDARRNQAWQGEVHVPVSNHKHSVSNGKVTFTLIAIFRIDWIEMECHTNKDNTTPHKRPTRPKISINLRSELNSGIMPVPETLTRRDARFNTTVVKA